MTASLLEQAVRAHGPEAVAAKLTHEQLQRLRYEWGAWARPEQLAPSGEWLIWLLLAGRGFGKTRCGAEWVRQFAFEHPGCRIAMIARTAADVRSTMLEGPSGLLSISPPWFTPHHSPGTSKLTWPNGSIALTFSAEEPKGLRGPQFHAAWCDELAAWACVTDEDAKPGVPFAWTQLEFGMRLPGSRPRIMVTTTPRPTVVIRKLLTDRDTVTTRGSTFDNEANLAPEFIARLHEQWDGTRLGRQELYAEVLDDTPGALWTRSHIDDLRVRAAPEMARVVVGVDPSGGHSEDHDEQGIVVCGRGVDGHGYVLSDRTCKKTPDGWGRQAVEAYLAFKGDRIVAEKNYGGEMVEHVIRTAARDMGVPVSFKLVDATHGKVIRAEPVAALHEQGRQHHVGTFDKLEDQLCNFTNRGIGGKVKPMSPDRADAMVWAMTELFIGEPRAVPGERGPGGERRFSATPDEDDEPLSRQRW